MTRTFTTPRDLWAEARASPSGFASIEADLACGGWESVSFRVAPSAGDSAPGSPRPNDVLFRSDFHEDCTGIDDGVNVHVNDVS